MRTIISNKSFALLAVGLVLAAFLAGVLGCGDDDSSSSDNTPVTILLGGGDASSSSGEFGASSVPSEVVKVVFTITGPDMDPIEQTVSVTDGMAEVQSEFTVPTGGDRVFYVEAMDSAGVVIYSGSTTADLDGSAIAVTVVVYRTDTPSTPTGLSAAAVDRSQITVSWTASTDNTGVSGYRIYRDGSEIASSATTSYADTGLGESTQYCYTVTAYDAAGNASAESAGACITTMTGAAAMYTASGTYSYAYDPATAEYSMTATFTTSYFVDEGPESGETLSAKVTWMDANTIEWTEDDGWKMKWTRTGGTVGDLTGTWIMSEGKDSFELTFTDDYTLKVVGYVNLIHGDSRHDSGGYNIELEYGDPGCSASSVSMTGYGIMGSLALVCDSNDGEWRGQVFLGATYPSPPLTYTVTITDGTGTWSDTATVDCFMDEFVTGVSVSVGAQDVTFSWTPVGQSDVQYEVHMHDSCDNCLDINPMVIDGSSVTYTGTLPDDTYTFWVNAQPVDGTCESNVDGGTFNIGAGGSCSP
jgi:hypothetical protein